VVVLQSDVGSALSQGLASVSAFVPKLVAFLLILVVGWLCARVVARVVDRILERVGFDRAVERGGVRQALARSRYDASDILSKLVFYALMLFVLQLAFGVFGSNPISDLIYAVIAFLPKVFVAVVIVVVTAAVAAAVKEVVEASLGGLSYGRALAGAASGAVLVVGLFAALNQLQIAPEIVNGLFYALLAVVAGSAIVAVGGGGIAPMRRQWEKAIVKAEDEGPRVRQEVQGSGEDITQRAHERAEQAPPRG
jgi:hypothetical protein